MSGVNKVIIVGRLGTDPELKSVGSGQNVTRLDVATSENWMGKDGQKQERTEWHRVVIWGRQAENCVKFLSKGRLVFVEGRLQTRSWEDRQGQKRYMTEIVANNVQFLGGGSDRNDRTSASQEATAGGSSASGRTSGGSTEDFQDFGPEPKFDGSDEIPF